MTSTNQHPEEIDTVPEADVRVADVREGEKPGDLESFDGESHDVENLDDDSFDDDEDNEEDSEESTSRVSLIAAWIVGGLCTAVFGFSVWAGIGNLVGIPAIASALDQTMAPIGWTWLIILVALPVVTFAAALLLGVGRKPWTRVLLLIVGLGVLSGMQLNATHIMPLTQYFL